MNKKKYFVFSDVHGEYDALMHSLQEAGYDHSNGTHQLVSLGDAFDRGPNSRKVYQFLRQNHAICVKGNHDEFFEEYLEKGMDGEFVLFNILHNGLGDTIHSFTGLPDKEFDYKTVDRAKANVDSTVLPWLKSMPLYFETKHFIFVHAGFDPNLHDWKLTDRHYMLWDIQDSHCPIHSTQKVVIIGHHHAFRVKENAKAVGFNTADVNDVYVRLEDPDGGASQTQLKNYGNTDEHSPYCYGNKIAIDGCTNLTKKVNVLVFEDYPMPDETEKEKEPEPTTINGDGISYTVHYDNNTTISYADYARAFAQMGVTVNEAMQNAADIYATTTRF